MTITCIYIYMVTLVYKPAYTACPKQSPCFLPGRLGVGTQSYTLGGGFGRIGKIQACPSSVRR